MHTRAETCRYTCTDKGLINEGVKGIEISVTHQVPYAKL